jgi:hypothetical protein
MIVLWKFSGSALWTAHGLLASCHTAASDVLRRPTLKIGNAPCFRYQVRRADGGWHNGRLSGPRNIAARGGLNFKNSSESQCTTVIGHQLRKDWTENTKIDREPLGLVGSKKSARIFTAENIGLAAQHGYFSLAAELRWVFTPPIRNGSKRLQLLKSASDPTPRRACF